VGHTDRKLIIALGNSALRSLLHNHSHKITAERGKAFQTEWGVVVATLHPAAILRSFGEYPRFLADLRYAAGFLQGQTIREPGTTRWDLVTPANFAKVSQFLTEQPYLGADIETGGFNPRGDPILCLSVAWTKNRVAVFPLMHPLDLDHCLFDNERLYFDAMKDLLEAEGPRWVWHNGKYDTSFFQELGIDARVDEDTMLMHYALNEVRGTHDLAQLGADYLGAPNWKSGMFEEAKAAGYVETHADSFAKIPPKIIYPYNARDADLTLQLFQELKAEISLPKNAGLPKLYEHLLIPASKFLQEVEANGMWVSTEYLDLAEEEYQARLDAERFDILQIVEPLWDPAAYAKITGAKKVPKFFNPGSWQHKLYILRDVLGYRIKNTRKETLADIPKNPLVDALLRWMATNKVISTYIRGVQERIDHDGRVHATYLIHGTVTGRLSSRNPNMQNIPRDKAVRNMFQAPEGKKLVEYDYSQGELRVLATFSGDVFLKGVYRDGRDLHDEVSIALFPNWQKHTVLGNEQRIRAKFLNFGIAYGRGAKSIHEEFGMPMEEAQRMIRDWFKRAPEAAKYIEECRAAPQEGRILKTPFGRRRRFTLVTRDNLVPIQNEAVNFAIQSTLSDLTLLSAIRMRVDLFKRWEARIVNLVHDSILMEIPDDVDVDEMSEYVKGTMEALPATILHTDVPFVVDAKIGTRWGDFKG
jgi:DNA polymerase-1